MAQMRRERATGRPTNGIRINYQYRLSFVLERRPSVEIVNH